MNTRSITVAVGLLISAAHASADMPDSVLVGARIEVSSNTIAYSDGKPVKLPGGIIEVYLWRTVKDPEVDFSTPFAVGKLANARQNQEITFTPAKDVFEIKNPRPLVVTTRGTTQTIKISDITRMEPFSSLINGRILYPGKSTSVLPKWAQLLRTGAPHFSCSIGYGDFGEYFAVSYNPDVSAKQLERFCAKETDRTPTEVLKTINAYKNVFVMEILSAE